MTAPVLRLGPLRHEDRAAWQRLMGGGADRLHWLTHHTNARARRLYDRVAVHKGFIRYNHPMPP